MCVVRPQPAVGTTTMNTLNQTYQSLLLKEAVNRMQGSDFIGSTKAFSPNQVSWTLAFLPLFLFLYLQWKTYKPLPNLKHIPSVDLGTRDRKKLKDEYITNALKVMKKGYEQFGNHVYKVWTTDGWRVLITKEEALALKSMPTSKLSSPEAVMDIFMGRYVLMGKRDAWAIEVLQSDLTFNIKNLTHTIWQELALNLGSSLSQVAQDWKPIDLNAVAHRALARVSALAFVGSELNHNEDWLHIAETYGHDLYMGGRKLKSWPAWTRPIVQYFVPEIKNLYKKRARAEELLRPIVLSRVEQMQSLGEKYVRKVDTIQWQIERSIKATGRVLVSDIAYWQLLYSFAAMHTTRMSCTQALYDIAARPEYVPELRTEMEEFLSNDGYEDRRQVMEMRKLDSLLKESQRLNPPGSIAFIRKALEPIQLTNNVTIPKGTILSVPTMVLDTERPDFPEASKFDPFRFFKLRQRSRLDSAKHQFAEASPETMHFGYGRYACPGRFFASHEIKLLITWLVSKYDMQIEPVEGKSESGERPANIMFETQVIPDPTVKVLMRKRQDA